LAVKIEFTEEFVKEFEKVVPKQFRRELLNNVITNLKAPIQPSRFRKKLSADRPPYFHGKEVWQLRIDGYRFFYEILDNNRLVIVFFVGEKGTDTTETMYNKRS